MVSPIKSQSSKLIVGSEILDRFLITDGEAENLKHATYDLTIGEIFPVDKEGYKEKRQNPISSYAIKPNEAVWLLSKEEFQLPATVTGLATLRTTFTKQGLVAFNVGIIDPFYKGPISTVLLNFSRRSVEVELGDKFFRVLFFEHDDVTEHHAQDENVDRAKYRKDITSYALNDYSQSFLDIPVFDNEFYSKTTWQLFWGSVSKHPFYAVVLAVVLLAPIAYVWTLPEYLEWWESIRTLGSQVYSKLTS
jgi:deoxycytidine triphosphate deaminase